jgi:hypothetical protein
VAVQALCGELVSNRLTQTRAFSRSKYFAKKVKLDGQTFDSKRESVVYASLKMLADRGEINALEVHPRFDLHVNDSTGIKRKIGQAVLDFKYWDTRDKRRHYVDVKGMDLPLSKWKRAHIETEYGITVELWK